MEKQVYSPWGSHGSLGHTKAAEDKFLLFILLRTENLGLLGVLVYSALWNPAFVLKMEFHNAQHYLMASFNCKSTVVSIERGQINSQIQPLRDLYSHSYWFQKIWVMQKLVFVYLLFLKIILLLFKYSCLHFPPTPPPYPSQTRLPSWKSTWNNLLLITFSKFSKPKNWLCLRNQLLDLPKHTLAQMQ